MLKQKLILLAILTPQQSESLLQFVRSFIQTFVFSDPVSLWVDLQQSSAHSSTLYQELKDDIPESPEQIPELQFIQEISYPELIAQVDILLRFDDDGELEPLSYLASIKGKATVSFQQHLQQVNEYFESEATFFEQLKSHPDAFSLIKPESQEAKELIYIERIPFFYQHEQPQIIGLGLSPGDNIAKAIQTFFQVNSLPGSVALWGEKQSGKALFHDLKSTHVSVIKYFDEFQEAVNSEFRLGIHFLEEKEDFQWLVLATEPQSYQTSILKLVQNWDYHQTVILPYFKRGVFNSDYFKAYIPSIFLAYPCAGTGRFFPVIYQVLNQCGRSMVNYQPLYQSHHFLKHQKWSYPSEQFHQKLKAFSSAQLLPLNALNYMVIHDEFFHADFCEDFPSMNFVALIRDPRDVLVCTYFNYYASRDFEDLNELKEERLIQLIEEGLNFQYASTYKIWPPMRFILSHFLKAVRSEQIYVVRFEDLHSRELEVYGELFEWLQLEQDMFIPELEPLIQQAIPYGSFEHQTRGKFKRGEDNEQRVYVEGIGPSTCRKGISGDWKNHFTPAVKKAFKDVGGVELIGLGYEDGLDW